MSGEEGTGGGGLSAGARIGRVEERLERLRHEQDGESRHCQSQREKIWEELSAMKEKANERLTKVERQVDKLSVKLSIVIAIAVFVSEFIGKLFGG